MLLFRKRLCEAIGRHKVSRKIIKDHVPSLELLANVVILNIDMLSLLVILRVLSKRERTLIVTVDCDWLDIRPKVLDFHQKMPHPGCFPGN